MDHDVIWRITVVGTKSNIYALKERTVFNFDGVIRGTFVPAKRFVRLRNLHGLEPGAKPVSPSLGQVERIAPLVIG